jgi:septum formation protein
MLAELLHNHRIILASSSPRRRELLSSLGIQFEVIKPPFDEAVPVSNDPEAIARSLAFSKARQVKEMEVIGDKDILITADTIVWCDNRVLNKPSGREEAIEMLNTLSGKSHLVVTGVCLLSGISDITFSSGTLVTFKKLSDEEISYYVDNYKPFDKAGAYGIQEWIGFIAVESISGSYYNVMGLPVQKLYTELCKFVKP